MKLWTCSLSMALLGTTLLLPAPLNAQKQSDDDRLKATELGKTRNAHVIGNLFLSGQPQPEDFDLLKKAGIETVINLRTKSEIDWDEPAAAKEIGARYVPLPVGSAEALDDQLFETVRKELRRSTDEKVLLHCASANRVGAVWLTYRVLDQEVPLERAMKEAKEVGLRSPALKAKALDYIKTQKDKPQSKESVKPGINDSFLDPEMKLDQYLSRFEVESREVYHARDEVLKRLDLQPGDRVADIGAGTGFFSRLFVKEVGSDGWVYSVDISPTFISHIRDQIEEKRLTNTTAILCPGNSTTLPPKSVDLVFICDTYHHFEYPDRTLKSIHQALSKDGTLVVIDFERIPGKSRDFILGHVRAGKPVFRREIESAGFELVREESIDAFKENYFLRFRKK